MPNFEGPKMPEQSDEKKLEETKKKLAESIEWFNRIKDRLDPDILNELQVLADFAQEHFEVGPIRRHEEASDETEAEVAEDIVARFNEYHRWLRSKDAQEDTSYFKKKVESFFDEEGKPIHEELVSRVADHMTLEEQKEVGLLN